MSLKRSVNHRNGTPDFQDFRDPYLRLTAEEYAAMAERNGFQV